MNFPPLLTLLSFFLLFSPLVLWLVYPLIISYLLFSPKLKWDFSISTKVILHPFQHRILFVPRTPYISLSAFSVCLFSCRTILLRFITKSESFLFKVSFNPSSGLIFGNISDEVIIEEGKKKQYTEQTTYLIMEKG